MTARSFPLLWAGHAWQLSVPCTLHSREGNTNWKPAENGKSIVALWLCSAFFTPLYHPHVTLHRPKTEAVTRAPPMMESARLELKAPWGKCDNALWFTVERNSDPKTWGTCIKPEPERGCRSLIPCSYILMTRVSELSSQVWRLHALLKKQTQASAPSSWHSSKSTGRRHPWGCHRGGVCRDYLSPLLCTQAKGGTAVTSQNKTLIVNIKT